jgi:hypothetical protein
MGIQAVYQRWTQTHKAALIYLLEPVFARFWLSHLGRTLKPAAVGRGIDYAGGYGPFGAAVENGDYKSNKA